MIKLKETGEAIKDDFVDYNYKNDDLKNSEYNIKDILTKNFCDLQDKLKENQEDKKYA